MAKTLIELQQERESIVQSYNEKVAALNEKRDKQLAKLDDQIEKIESAKANAIVESLKSKYGTDDLEKLAALISGVKQETEMENNHEHE
ncbi:MAG: hypothetical protein LBT37_06070 [Lactobacillaceae bacterium]|jgi:hypothetical protein|nr:hypothetical protein [Lactobacillaceae bacterium]